MRLNPGGKVSLNGKLFNIYTGECKVHPSKVDVIFNLQTHGGYKA